MPLQVTTLFLKQRSADYSNKDLMAQLCNDFIVGEHQELFMDKKFDS
jgi:hypothetical protein